MRLAATAIDLIHAAGRERKNNGRNDARHPHKFQHYGSQLMDEEQFLYIDKWAGLKSGKIDT